MFKQNNKGFSLIETLVAMAVFAVFAIGIYQAFIGAIRLVRTSGLMVEASSVANEQFEIAHNLAYSDVGLISGIPAGKLQASKMVVRGSATFLVKTTVRNIDDPFDGTLGGSPGDTSPADYKLVEIAISLPANPQFKPLAYTKFIAPKNLENSSTNGALFVHVIDANGQPVSEASVHIENNAAIPPIVVDDVTNSNGYLQIVDVPPAVEAYEVSVFKAGYSSEQTYQSGAVGNPNPIKKHATVAAQTVTDISFSIDVTGTVNMETVTETCAPVPNVGFDLGGAKLIGMTPDIVKYQNSFATGVDGKAAVNGLEWDTYNLVINDAGKHLAGSISIVPFTLNPGSTQDVKMVVADNDPNSVLVSVKQAGTQLPLSGVEVKLESGTSSVQKITGRGFLRQTDWSGGSGQEVFSNQTQYQSSDGNIEDNDPAGDVRLKSIASLYASDGYLTSSAFDTGSVSNFYQLGFLPLSQPAAVGTSSVKLQIATNNDNTTWDYLGPDGSSSTFYTLSDLNINSAHNGDRYFRYRLYLSTASSTVTPSVTEVSFTFSSLCVPSGQAVFNGLADGIYTLTASKTGFQTYTDNINVSIPWQQQDIILQPE
jgi:prepilin-type N-terminal cleavage/methylation domain-containing protein